MWTHSSSSVAKLSRRGLLKKGALLVGGAGLLFGWSASGADATKAAPADAGLPTPTSPWETLGGRLQGSLVRPGEPAYQKVSAPWNLRYANVQPEGVVRCASPADVQEALLWAESERVPLAVRAGGLSQAGHSCTTGLLVDVSPLNKVTLDPEGGLLHVGAGARHSDLFAVLRESGRTLTHGRTPRLGVAGMVLGGGMGFNMRRHGLLCDQLMQVDLVTADGQISQCSREKNAELFWACRGGGGGQLAVGTAFTFRTFPAQDVTAFRICWSSDLEDILPTLMSLLPETTYELGCQVSVRVGPSGAMSLELLGQLYGTPEMLLQVLEPAYQIAVPKVEQVELLPYWEAMDFLADKGGPGFLQERSRYMYAEFPIEGCDLVLDRLRQWPGTGGGVAWKAFLLGGAIDNVARRATAYVHRGASMLGSISLSWKADDAEERLKANFAWLDDFHARLEPFTSRESYQNFADPAQTDYLQAYYAENLSYLTSLKRRLDPRGTFDSPQGLLAQS